MCFACVLVYIEKHIKKDGRKYAILTNLRAFVAVRPMLEKHINENLTHMCGGVTIQINGFLFQILSQMAT